MVIELALAVWLGAQPTSAASPANLSDIARHLPELDEIAASEALGLRDLYYSVRWAAADLWLRPEMIDPGEASWGFYSAEHAYMRDPTRAVALSWEYAEDGPGPRSRYVVARRVRYTSGDIETAVATAFPVELMVEGYRRYARSGNPQDWPEARTNWMPGADVIARLVRVERSIIDEPSCPGLTSALRQLNGLDVPPVRLDGYGAGDEPPTAPEGIWIVGDGTSFTLEVELANDEPRPTLLTLTGSHGSLPGAWIETFEALTEDCWRPDQTLHAQG